MYCSDFIQIWYLYLIGYFFSIFGSQFFVKKIVDLLWLGIGWTGNRTNDKVRTHAWHSSVVGGIESIIYTTAILIGRYEIIVGWFVFKVAGQWGKWQNDVDFGSNRVAGRTIYNIFLIGSALSLFYGAVGAGLVIWVIRREYLLLRFAVGGLVIGSIVLWIVVLYYLQKDEDRKKIKKFLDG